MNAELILSECFFIFAYHKNEYDESEPNSRIVSWRVVGVPVIGEHLEK